MTRANASHPDRVRCLGFARCSLVIIVAVCGSNLASEADLGTKVQFFEAKGVKIAYADLKIGTGHAETVVLLKELRATVRHLAAPAGGSSRSRPEATAGRFLPFAALIAYYRGQHRPTLLIRRQPP
jgi:hypothetical protein